MLEGYINILGSNVSFWSGDPDCISYGNEIFVLDKEMINN